MAITRVKPPGWGVGEKLTSGQQNQLDLNTTYALDKRSGETDTLGSVVSCDGGRIVREVQAGTDADGTYLVTNGTIISAPVLTATREYTLSVTGALAGDIVDVRTAASGSNVRVFGASHLATLGPSGEARSASFMFDGAAWQVHHNVRRGIVLESFTASGSFVVPDGVTAIVVEGFGGGGGGGGSNGGPNSNANWCSGGGGGGGSMLVRRTVGVTPGDTLTIAIGAGGAGGSAFADGSPGGASTVTDGAPAVIFRAAGASGGCRGGTPVATSSSQIAPGGGPVPVDTAYIAPRNVTPGTSPILVHGPGIGGAGIAATASTISPSGNTSLEGHTPGLGGISGVTSSGYFGGGGGGGGAAGPGGAGGVGGSGSNGNASGAASNPLAGDAAAANTGAGGGGGGGCGAGNGSSGSGAAGGNGGSGRLWIAYVR